MKIIDAGYEILTPVDNQMLIDIEVSGRVCYKSEDRITETSAEQFIRNLIKAGHEAMIEHRSITVKFIVDRGVSHEIVRHRIASYAQESTRYCNYGKDKFGNEITVIRPCFFKDGEEGVGNKYFIWLHAMEQAEKNYFMLLNLGATPQEARSVLPNSLKTEIIVTMNIREWRHFFKLRTAKVAHPQIREVAIPLLKELQQLAPALFEDIGVAE